MKCSLSIDILSLAVPGSSNFMTALAFDHCVIDMR